MPPCRLQDIPKQRKQYNNRKERFKLGCPKERNGEEIHKKLEKEDPNLKRNAISVTGNGQNNKYFVHRFDENKV